MNVAPSALFADNKLRWGMDAQSYAIVPQNGDAYDIGSASAPIGTLYGTTSVAAILDKGGAVYNLKAFNPVGGGADDSAAFAAAFAAAGTGTVVIPPGTWSFSSTLSPNCSIIGEGQNCILNYLGTGTAIYVYSVTHVKLSGFLLKAAAGDTSRGIWIDRCQHVSIDASVRLLGFFYYGIHMTSSYYCRIVGARVDGSGRAGSIGIYLDGSGSYENNANWVYNVRVYGFLYGIVNKSGRSNSIRDCTIEDLVGTGPNGVEGTVGVLISSAPAAGPNVASLNITVENVYVEGANTAVHVDGSGYGVAGRGAEEITINQIHYTTPSTRTFYVNATAGSTSLKTFNSLPNQPYPGTFYATDATKAIVIPGAGVAGADLSTTVAAYVSATEVTLTAPASTTITGTAATITRVYPANPRAVNVVQATGIRVGAIDVPYYGVVTPDFNACGVTVAASGVIGLVLSEPQNCYVNHNLTLANGLNSDIYAPLEEHRIVGPTGGFSVGGFQNPTRKRRITLYNSTSQQMTIVDSDASSAAANRIRTLTGANVVLRAGTSAATFDYDNLDQRWMLISYN